MSWYHRQEYLDAHMADSNWKKLLRMGKTIPFADRFSRPFTPPTVPTFLRKWNACLDQVEDSEEYYQSLCQRIGAHRVREYTKQEAAMQNARDQDVTVMDAMDVKGEEGVESCQAASVVQLVEQLWFGFGFWWGDVFVFFVWWWGGGASGFFVALSCHVQHLHIIIIRGSISSSSSSRRQIQNQTPHVLRTRRPPSLHRRRQMPWYQQEGSVRPRTRVFAEREYDEQDFEAGDDDGFDQA